MLLALASFASQAMVRVTDSLLPQIAADVGTTVGAASVVVTAYAVTHGSVQLIVGPLGDRFGKVRTITIACASSALLVLLCGLAQSLTALGAARFACGAAAAWIIPLSIAYVGDVTPYERRQQVLARYLSGQILGQLFGQAAGGILGDLFGWRAVFFFLAGLFAIAAAALLAEIAVRRPARTRGSAPAQSLGMSAAYRVVLSNPWGRTVLLAVFIEGALMYGVFSFVGADLNQRFGFSFTAVGLTVACFALGGLLYALSVRALLIRFGQPGIILRGALLAAAAYVALALSPVSWLAPLCVVFIGLGFYMLHNTLQTTATQMSPEASGTALALFASGLYFGQTIGVAAAAPVVDRVGAPAVFAVCAAATAALGLWFSRRLAAHQAASTGRV